MKKIALAVFAALSLILSGCDASVEHEIKTLKDWSFQYNAGTKDYSLFFGLCDTNDEYFAAAADVDVRIENENGDIVYKGVTSITKNNFNTFHDNQTNEKSYLADVRIDEDDIQKGTSSSGTVYFSVYNEDLFTFDECNCPAWRCLPVKDIQLLVPSLPIELKQIDYDGSIETKYLISDIRFTIDNSSGSSCLIVVISGEKTYDKNDGLTYDFIGYKLYDSEKYLIDSGPIRLDAALDVGDKFRIDSLVVDNLSPGETYTLQLLDHIW